jgi:hypothetical protein
LDAYSIRARVSATDGESGTRRIVLSNEPLESSNLSEMIDVFLPFEVSLLFLELIFRNLDLFPCGLCLGYRSIRFAIGSDRLPL